MRLAGRLTPFQKPADTNSNFQLETSRGRAALARGVARIGVALVLLAVLCAHRGAAQACPTSPSYSPDFSANQNCLALFGNGFNSSAVPASFQPGGAGTLLQITPNSTQQRGYAWYKTPQPVGNSFSTTFTFQLTGGSNPPADGIAFVIQNSSTGASTVGPTGSDGCGLGFGDDPSGAGNVCVNATGGITNSVAVGFKISNNGDGLPGPDSVFIASNGTGANCVDTVNPNCVIAENDLSGTDATPNSFGCEGSGICMADGNVHTVTITYALLPTATESACFAPASNAPLPCLDVIVDGIDLFPTGVPFNMTSIGLTNNTAFVGFTGATGGSVENNDILSWTFTPQSFGDINVCPSGATTPAPCSNTIPVTFSVPAGTTINSVSVLTQGVSGLDFSLASAGTCTGTFSTAGPCTVNVTFAPQAPGLRMGAVSLVPPVSSPSGVPLATTLIYGVGQGPAVAFGPGAQTTVNTGSYSITTPNGVAVDAAGDIFIADGADGVHGKVVEVAANGTATSYGFTLAYPQGLAVDGAGDLFIADNNRNFVIEVPAGCTSSACEIDNAFGLNSQLGVAVDGAGDLFVSSFGEHEVVEVPANGGAQRVVYSPGTSSNPIGLAVDAAGDLFVADFGLKQVVEITPSGTQTKVGTGWDLPEAVAVDAAGDVFVADEAPKVVEVPAGCVNNLNNCQITISNILAYGIAVDAKGDVFLPERSGHQVLEVNGSQPPSLSFNATNQGITSSDSPQTVSVQNVGNAALALSAISFPLDFPEVSDENDCSAGAQLIPGQDCPLTIDFTPTVGSPPPGTPLTEAVGLTDNALNVTGAPQSISVQGDALSPDVNVPNLVGQTQLAASTTLAGIGLVLSPVTSEASTVPIGEIVSQSPTVGTSVLVGSSVSVVISSGVAVPNVVGQTQTTAGSSITGAGLVGGTTTTQFSDTVPSGNVISQSPDPGTAVNGGTTVSLVVSSGVPPAQDQLALVNNYFVTGDYATGGISLRGSSSGTITVPTASPCAAPNCGPGVPDGADIIDGFLYWTTIETSATPSGNTGTFLGYSITGQQIGTDVPNYSDGTNTGTLRVYRADVNNYFQVPPSWNGARQGSGQFAVTFPNSGGTVTEGASLVVIYRVLSSLFPLKSVVIYNGSIAPSSLNAGPIPQAVQGFYDAVGGANGTGEVTHLYTSGGTWYDSESSQTLGQSNEYIDTLSTGNAYAAVILSTPVNNSDNDGILDAWKAAQGYTDVQTGAWVPLPGATAGEKDLFVQFDYMCSAITANNTCDFTQPNLYPSPDAQGNDPLAMVTQAFANYGVHLHLKPGNAISESTCTDVPGQQTCEFPNQPGVVAWNGSVELSKVWPVNLADCEKTPSLASCAPRFPYGQKDSYHYVLFGYSLAIPAWTTRAGSITSITTTSGGGAGTLVTTGLGTTCPTRITISGVQGNPNLNAIYDGVSCDSELKTIYFTTPSTVPAWTYPNNTLPEPVIAVTSGKVTSISGYSDLGGADSVVSLGQWESSPTQDMSKAATVVAGTLLHELGHTLGLSHGGLYFDTPGTYIPTFEGNCKPNYQSSMNYLFQLDGVGPNSAVTYSNQALEGETLGASPTRAILGGDSDTVNPNFTTLPFGSVANLTDSFGNPASFTTSAWYTTTPPSSTASAATMHCDGSPLNNDTAYRVTGPVDSISPAWSDGQNIAFDGAKYLDLRGFDDTTALDLRQVGATSGDFASLAGETSYGSGGVTFAGSGGVTFAGSGGVTYAGSGGVTFAGSGGVLFAGSGGVLFAGSGGVTFAGSGGVTFAGSGGVTFAGSGGVTFAGSGGVTFAGSGGVTFAGSGGASTNELDYLTANSIVRPPNSPTITPVLTNGVVTSVIVDWRAPVFGVVQSYTVFRSSSPNGANPIQIGIVNGAGGLPPATEFIDSNPLGSSTVVYTIATTLAPVQIDPTQRSSPPSVPAIVKSHQTIVLGPLESSVTYANPAPMVTVTATAQSNGSPNGLQVNFVATGPCSVNGQTVASIASGGVSTATVTINNPGSSPASCTVVASQPGTNPTTSSTPPYYDAANSVSESFTIEPEGSTLQSQTISWSTLPNVQYGSTFSLSAIAEANNVSDGLPVTFSASGPCKTSGATTGVGPCTITASQAGDGTHSPATVSQSFNITPVVLTVTAASPTITYGQSIPSLTPILNVNYGLTGFVNNDLPSVVSGVPSLSGTALAGSNVGSYTITISTGSLAAANYSFLFANGTLTIQQARQAITLSGVPATAAYNSQFTVGATGGASGISVVFTSAGSCSNSGATYTMNSGTGSCSVIANQAGNTNYSPAIQVIQSVSATPATQKITFTQNAPLSAAYNSHFTVGASGGASGISVVFTSAGSCSNSGTTYTMTLGTGSCSVIANQGGNTNYSGATQVTQTVAATLASATISISNLPSTALIGGTFMPTYSYAGNGAPRVTSSTTGVCSVSGAVVNLVGVGSCTLTASALATSDYAAATGSAQSFTVVEAPTITSANNATYTVGTSGTFTVTATSYPAASITESGALPNGITYVNNNNGTGTLSGKATVSGIYPITFTAQNGVGAAATQSFTLTSETTVPASSTTCNGVYIGTFSGNITVSSGQNCIFEKGGATGNITENGGTLALSNATIGGNIQVGGGTYAIGPSTTIKGSLTIQSIPTGTAQNLICGVTVTGNLTLQSVGTAATIGSGTPTCPANTISGGLTLQANKAAVVVAGNTIKDSVTDQSNTAATTFTSNAISGSLTDQGNSAPSTLSLNSVTGSLVDQSNSASSVMSQNTVKVNMTVQGNTGPAQVTSNKVTGTLVCQSNTSITGSGDTAAKLQGQCASF